MTTLSSMNSSHIQLSHAPQISSGNWQDPAKVQQILKKTRLDRKRLFQILRQLDINKTLSTTFSIFQQAATDNDILLD